MRMMFPAVEVAAKVLLACLAFGVVMGASPFPCSKIGWAPPAYPGEEILSTGPISDAALPLGEAVQSRQRQLDPSHHWQRRQGAARAAAATNA